MPEYLIRITISLIALLLTPPALCKEPNATETEHEIVLYDPPALIQTNYFGLLDIPESNWLGFEYDPGSQEWALIPVEIRTELDYSYPVMTHVERIPPGPGPILKSGTLKPSDITVIGGTVAFEMRASGNRAITDNCALAHFPCHSRYKLGIQEYEIEFVENDKLMVNSLTLRRIKPNNQQQVLLDGKSFALYESGWMLDFIGDLDGDKLLDIIITPSHEGTEPIIFLSSLAKTEEFLVQPITSVTQDSIIR